MHIFVQEKKLSPLKFLNFPAQILNFPPLNNFPNFLALAGVTLATTF